MKLLITGSRSQNDYEKLKYGIAEIEKLTNKTTEILHGGAIGNDKLAERYANENGIKQTIIKPNYNYFGRAAPLLRNNELIRLCDFVLAIFSENGKTPGTKYTVEKSKKAGKTVVEVDKIGECKVTYKNLLL
jgi:hypothetical protein